MGVVTYTPVPTASVPTGTDVYGSFYTIKGNSLEVINGSLEAANLLGGSGFDFKADYTMLQHNSTSGGGMVAGTANLDYFTGDLLTDGWFNGLGGNPEAFSKKSMLPIPGGTIQFYLPFKAFVLFTWQITWIGDTIQNTSTVNIRFLVDNLRPGTRDISPITDVANALASPNVRRSSTSIHSSEESAAAGVPEANKEHLRDRYKSRYWCGHQWLDNLDQGWHSASLRVVAGGNTKQVRVRARSMKYIYFKREG